MELYRIVLKVRPAVAHPLYWEWQFGFLLVWLMAESPYDAGRRASDIVALLPYEVIGSDESAPALVTQIQQPSARQDFCICEDRARQLGVAFLVRRRQDRGG